MDTGKESPLVPSAPAQKVMPKQGTLVAIVGIVAATLLFKGIPQDESGRNVDVHIANDGTATLTNVSGKQYLIAYLDIAGVGTACDGLTRYQGKPIKAGMKFTEAQCSAMLEQELVMHAKIVMACTNWDTQRRPYQIFSSVSMQYNTGNWCGSTAQKRVKAGDIAGGCDALLMWNKATINGLKIVSNGLDRRRHREREYCLTNIKPGSTPQNLQERLKPWL